MISDKVRDGDRASMNERDVDEMVRRLAHSVRNPLAAIKSGVQLIQRLTQPSGDVAGYFDSLLHQVTRIDQIVGDMQVWTKLTPGAVASVGVRDALERAVAARRSDAERVGVGLTVAAGVEACATIDAGNLQLALEELLTNALRFAPPGSAVVLSWSVRPDGMVEISVDDAGPGVAAENADRIFTPFFSTSTQGTGLGLSLAEKVCIQVGGRLCWRNLPGEGCRFSLVLPSA